MNALKMFDKDIRIDGSVVRVGCLKAEYYEFVLDRHADIPQAARQIGTRIDLFTFVETLTHTSPRFAYPTKPDNLAALNISTFDHWWTKQISGKTRNMVRRAEKRGVTVREVPFDDVLVQGISQVYNESKIRQGKRFAHYQKDLATVCKENSTFLDRAVFIGAFLGEDLVGFAKLVSDEDRQQAGLMQIVSMIAHRDKAPTNALLAQAVKSCANRHIQYLFYSHFSYGNKRRDSLAEFKLHNGFQRVELPRYYVPLTCIGELALRLGLHRTKAVDYIPDSLQALLRRVRSRWIDSGTESIREIS